MPCYTAARAIAEAVANTRRLRPSDGCNHQKLVRSLSDQRDLDVLSCPLADEVHGDDRRGGYRLLEHRDDARQGRFERVPAQRDRSIAAREELGGLRGVGELVVLVRGASIADGVRGPGVAVETHQTEQQSRIDAAAQQQSHRNVRDEMALQCPLIDVEQLFRGVFVCQRRGELCRPEPVPALDAPTAVLEDRHRSRRKLPHAVIQRERGGCVAIAQEQVDCGDVDLGSTRERRQHRAQLGAEAHRTVVDAIVDELDPGRVAGDDQTLAAFVPDREAKHAVEPIEDLGSPLLVAVDDDLGIRLCRKT